MNKLEKEIAILKERVLELEKNQYRYEQGRFDERRDLKAKLIDLIEEL
jgi:hypothetical protein